MKLLSPVFNQDEFIPAKYTCEGQDINPPLLIKDIPSLTESLSLIVDDPDAPAGTWVHWVVFNIPLISEIKENSVPGKSGINTINEKKYHGPCPPSGVHRYFFKLYALDVILDLKEGASKGALEKAMQGHVITETELVGLYTKNK